MKTELFAISTFTRVQNSSVINTIFEVYLKDEPDAFNAVKTTLADVTINRLEIIEPQLCERFWLVDKLMLYNIHKLSHSQV